TVVDEGPDPVEADRPVFEIGVRGQTEIGELLGIQRHAVLELGKTDPLRQVDARLPAYLVDRQDVQEREVVDACLEVGVVGDEHRVDARHEGVVRYLYAVGHQRQRQYAAGGLGAIVAADAGPGVQVDVRHRFDDGLAEHVHAVA